MERRHQEVTGAPDAVACEDAAGAVRAVRGGGEPDEQKPRVGIAEAGDRPAPVHLVTIGTALLLRYAGAVGPQPRTQFAPDDRAPDLRQRHAHGCITVA